MTNARAEKVHQEAIITAALLEQGYSEKETRKTLGLNWLRVFGAVWK
jgi:microsomal dipeptidase-like Zn-dependent dipeptidase